MQTELRGEIHANRKLKNCIQAANGICGVLNEAKSRGSGAVIQP